MNFIRAIINEEDIITDKEYLDLIEEIAQLAESNEIDEDAFDRIEKRVKDRHFALYRYFVGTKNLMLAKKFVEAAKKGESAPSTFVKGYLPVVEMIEDIVEAGPSYVHNLKVLHQRAKKRNN